MEDIGEFSSFLQEINNRGWYLLANPPNKISVDIIRELYYNSKPTNNDEIVSRTLWVREKSVSYGRGAPSDPSFP